MANAVGFSVIALIGLGFWALANSLWEVPWLVFALSMVGLFGLAWLAWERHLPAIRSVEWGYGTLATLVIGALFAALDWVVAKASGATFQIGLTTLVVLPGVTIVAFAGWLRALYIEKHQ